MVILKIYVDTRFLADSTKDQGLVGVKECTNSDNVRILTRLFLKPLGILAYSVMLHVCSSCCLKYKSNQNLLFGIYIELIK